MQFRIGAIFYVMALLAASISTFGMGGFVPFLCVLLFWFMFFQKKPPTLVELLVVVGVIFVLIALMLPDVLESREASRRSHCINNLKCITLALLNYHEDYGSFPPPYIADENGTPMHSWRTLILPYMEHQALYKAYNFSEPWNGPNNSKLAAAQIDIFHCPSADSAPNETNYFAVVGPGTAWPLSKNDSVYDVKDGVSNTILLIECQSKKVGWAEPVDLKFDEAVQLLTSTDTSVKEDGHYPVKSYFYQGTWGRCAAMADGSVVYLHEGMPRDTAIALLTAAGGETIDGNLEYESLVQRRLNWRNIYSLFTFFVLALLPMPWAIRARREQWTQTAGDASGKPDR